MGRRFRPGRGLEQSLPGHPAPPRRDADRGTQGGRLERADLRPGGEPDEGSANFFVDLELRESDRLAVMAVRTLIEIFGCLHPSFLSADGLEEDEGGVTLPSGDRR